jgi:hypothetical protein
MVMQRNGQIDPGMSAATDVQRASSMIFRIEGMMSERLGWPIEDVRPKVARSLNTSISTVTNIRRQRRKSVPAFLTAAIQRLLIQELQSEIQGLQHELDLVRQTNFGHHDDALAEAEAALAVARKVLEEAAGAS